MRPSLPPMVQATRKIRQCPTSDAPDVPRGTVGSLEDEADDLYWVDFGERYGTVPCYPEELAPAERRTSTKRRSRPARNIRWSCAGWLMPDGTFIPLTPADRPKQSKDHHQVARQFFGGRGSQSTSRALKHGWTRLGDAGIELPGPDERSLLLARDFYRSFYAGPHADFRTYIDWKTRGGRHVAHSLMLSEFLEIESLADLAPFKEGVYEAEENPVRRR